MTLRAQWPSWLKASAAVAGCIEPDSLLRLPTPSSYGATRYWCENSAICLHPTGSAGWPGAPGCQPSGSPRKLGLPSETEASKGCYNASARIAPVVRQCRFEKLTRAD